MKTKKTLRNLALAAATTALALAGTLAATGTAEAALERGTNYVSIWDDEPLYPGWHLDSAGARMIMQSDGNLVIYHGNTPVWATGTNNCGYKAVMQSDGNLVVYSANGGFCWALGTNGHPHARLTVSDNGAVFVTWGGDRIPHSGSGNFVQLSSDLYSTRID
ncbi:hypothetical protein [Kitasatospora sp. SUK 42]|uniref:hypothetical protein n=1 Tax=Kitasatospora sp. SUK 42 TaxID=1588882 RepID=UPI0018CAD50A|nr:hypothetical protein [Kitasatospora sp. SUK 42]MBV2152383.1 hypothetical protein [Kitasatospora sp. SUK 42]